MRRSEGPGSETALIRTERFRRLVMATASNPPVGHVAFDDCPAQRLLSGRCSVLFGSGGLEAGHVESVDASEYGRLRTTTNRARRT